MTDHHPSPDLAAHLSHQSMTEAHTARATLSLAAGRSASENRASVTRSAAPVLRTQLGAANAVDIVPLKRLTAGRKALKIAHAGETYLLRITKANKLILTKPAKDEKPPTDAKL